MHGGLNVDGEVLEGGEARPAESLNVDLRGVEMTLRIWLELGEGWSPFIHPQAED